jgi:hypothetical protein
MKNKNKVSKIPVLWLVLIVALFALSTTACSKSGGGSGGGGKNINSAAELKEYLDKQPANSPDKPIKVAMKVNDMMIKDIVKVTNEAGKYVSLDLSGSPLTEIPKRAFYERKTLAGIIIPNGVTSIGEDAFNGCESLKSVTIPNSVTYIGKGAFRSCDRLISVTIPSSVTIIGEWAFDGCTSLTSVTIPNTVTSIEGRAFDSCTNLTSVTFQGKSGLVIWTYKATPYNERTICGPFDGDLHDKYLAGGIGTYTTTAPVGWNSKWTKQ